MSLPDDLRDRESHVDATTFVRRVIAALWLIVDGWRAPPLPPEPPVPDAVGRAVDRMREQLMLVKKRRAKKSQGG